MTGRLIVVGTPIGNLDDMSPRAVQALQQADRILAEDTRHSAKLMRHFGITTPMSAWHAHNENDASRLQGLLKLLRQGSNLALISDAGMPLISDPGYSLVRSVREADLSVECVPGPTALTTALVLSGFPAERFVFDGFLPAKSTARKERLQALRQESRTVIVYESPHRLQASLADMCEILGPDRALCVARELTKRFESVLNGTAAEMLAWALDPEQVSRGEFVILIAPLEKGSNRTELDGAVVLRELLTELPARKAAKLTARLCGGKANDYYELAIEMTA